MELKMVAEGIGVIDGVFLQNEELIALSETGEWREGTAGNGVNPEVRITDVHDLNPESDLHKELLETIIASINEYGKNYPSLRITQGEHLRIMRYPEGGFYAPHADSGPENGRTLSISLFLNDDFEGGELVFPKQGVTIKPKAGQIVLFPSNFIYIHESTKITSGVKYSVVSWFR